MHLPTRIFHHHHQYKPPKYFYILRKLWLYVEILGWLILGWAGRTKCKVVDMLQPRQMGVRNPYMVSGSPFAEPKPRTNLHRTCRVQGKLTEEKPFRPIFMILFAK